LNQIIYFLLNYVYVIINYFELVLYCLNFLKFIIINESVDFIFYIMCIAYYLIYLQCYLLNKCILVLVIELLYLMWFLLFGKFVGKLKPIKCKVHNNHTKINIYNYYRFYLYIKSRIENKTLNRHNLPTNGY